MCVAQRLLQLALGLLWMQLLVAQQISWSAALGVALCLLLCQRPTWLGKEGRFTALSLGILMLWGCTTPIAGRSNWVPSLANLIWLMASLKLLEAQKKKQNRMPVLILLIGIGLAGLLCQTLAASLLQGICALLCIGALLADGSGPQPFVVVLQRGARLVGLLIPLVLLAFLLLPRLPAIWNLPDSQSATAGLSSTLKPGELAALVQTSGLAARVTFQANTPPPQEERYWRVIVHRRFDGSGWSPGSTTALKTPATRAASAPDQQWLVEPTTVPWRPWSGKGLPVTTHLQVSSTGTLWAGEPVRERSLYAISADQSGGNWRGMPPEALDLSFPAGSNPTLETLGTNWKREAANPAMRVQLAEQWFRSHRFSYSMTPGVLPEEASLDAFLFKSRAGFCEHYASSFSALMRAAGVPARVVVGYQGGEWQEPGSSQPYLRLENRDAHAWSEVWLPRRGWVEIDPTTWVTSHQARRALAKPRFGWLHPIVGQWQGLDLRWQLWVMQFDNVKQAQLLPSWVRGRWQGLIAIGAIGLGLAAVLTLNLRLERRQEPVDRARRALNQCLVPLRHLKLEPRTGETLRQFSIRASQAKPALEPLLNKLLAEYTRSRFSLERPSSKLLVQNLSLIKKELWDYVRKQRA